MINTTSKAVGLILEVMFDASLIGVILTVNNIEDLHNWVKLCTSTGIGMFTFIRIIHYVKDRKKGKNESTKSE